MHVSGAARGARSCGDDARRLVDDELSAMGLKSVLVGRRAGADMVHSRCFCAYMNALWRWKRLIEKNDTVAYVV